MNRRELLLGAAGILLLPERRVWALDRTMIQRGPILRKGDVIRFDLVSGVEYTYRISLESSNGQEETRFDIGKLEGRDTLRIVWPKSFGIGL